VGMGLGFRMKLLSFLVFFLVLSSCNQNKKLEEDLGSKVSPDDYEKVAVEAWGGDDILSIKKNDYAYVEKNISINYGPMRKAIVKAMTITNVVDEGDVVKNHLVVQSEEMQEGMQAKLSTRERVLAVKKVLNAESLSVKNVEDEIQSTPFEGFIEALNLCRYKTVECFKLKVEDFEENVPEETRIQNCRFFPGCKWKGKKVSFVIRVSYKEEGSDEIKTQNNIISYKIVPSMPYLFKMVEYCFEGLSEYQGQKFPVKVCTQIKDSIKGE
jgi:hypothetical protein